MKSLIVAFLSLSLPILAGVIEVIEKSASDAPEVVKHGFTISKQGAFVPFAERNVHLHQNLNPAEMMSLHYYERLERATEFLGNTLQGLANIDRLSEPQKIENDITKIPEWTEIASQDMIASGLGNDEKKLETAIEYFQAKATLEISKAQLKEKIATSKYLAFTGKLMANFQKYINSEKFRVILERIIGEHSVNDYINGLEERLAPLIRANTERRIKLRNEVLDAEAKLRDSKLAVTTQSNNNLDEKIIQSLVDRVSNELSSRSVSIRDTQKNALHNLIAIIRNAQDGLKATEIKFEQIKTLAFEEHVKKIQEIINGQSFKNILAQALGTDEVTKKEIDIFKTRIAVEVKKAALNVKVAAINTISYEGKILESLQERIESRNFRDTAIRIKGPKAGFNYLKELQKEFALSIEKNTAERVALESEISLAKNELEGAETSDIFAKASSNIKDKTIDSVIMQISDNLFASQISFDAQQQPGGKLPSIDEAKQKLLAASQKILADGLNSKQKDLHYTGAQAADEYVKVLQDISRSMNKVKNVEDHDLKAAEILLMLSDGSSH